MASGLNIDPSELHTSPSEHFEDLPVNDVKAELKTILAALDHTSIVAMTDTKGTITYANDKFCEISGYSRAELIGNKHSVLNSRFHDKSFFRELWKTIASGEVWHGEIKNKSKSRKEYWVDTTIVPFMDENNRPYKYVAIRRDVTDKKLIEQEIEEKRSKAIYAEKMAGLGEMSSGIAHEIGNPLAALRGRLEMLTMRLQSGPIEGEELLPFTGKMIVIIDRMTKIIRGLKSYSRDASKDPFSKIAINQLIADILEMSQDRLTKHNIQLRVSGLLKDIYINCREAEIGQVIVNLVNNSCDAIKQLEERWLDLQVNEADDCVEISITDSGSGIDSEIAQQVFNPFFTTKPAGKGTGLGLSISKNIIESHGGSLVYDANSNHTRFVVRLPKNSITAY